MADARKPFLKIAKQLKVSEGTIRNRVERLLKEGAIKRFTLELGATGGVAGLIGIKTEPRKGTLSVAASVARLAGIASCYEVSGEFDVFCMAEGGTLADVNAIVERIRGIKGVRETHTFMVLKKVS